MKKLIHIATSIVIISGCTSPTPTAEPAKDMLTSIITLWHGKYEIDTLINEKNGEQYLLMNVNVNKYSYPIEFEEEVNLSEYRCKTIEYAPHIFPFNAVLCNYTSGTLNELKGCTINRFGKSEYNFYDFATSFFKSLKIAPIVSVDSATGSFTCRLRMQERIVYSENGLMKFHNQIEPVLKASILFDTVNIHKRGVINYQYFAYDTISHQICWHDFKVNVKY